MYIGNNLQVANPSYKIIDDISSGFNGSATSFALQVNGETPVPFPINTQQVMLSVNGVVQEPDPSGSAGFKLLGSNIVFSSAPANGHAFFGVINAGADYVTAGSEFPDGSATAPSFTFQADQDTGWFRSGAGDVGYSSNGVAILNFNGNGLTIASGKGLTVDTDTLYVDATNNKVGISTTSPNSKFQVNDTNPVIAEFYHSDGGDNDEARIALGAYSSNPPAQRGVTLVAKNNSAGHDFIVNTSSSHSAGPTEKMRIDSSGRLLLGTTTEGEGDADNLTIADSGNCGISIRSGTSNDGAIFFSDGTSGTDEYKGTIQYTHSNDRLLFKTAATIALTIDSSQNATFAGNVGVGQSPNTKFNVVLAAQVADGTDDASDWGAGGIFQLDASGTAAANNEILFIGAHSGGVGQISSGIGFGRESTSNWGTYLSFKTHSADTSNIDALEERLRISANGNATFAGEVSVAGDLDIADEIAHIGDTNTKIRFPANDTVTIETSGTEALRLDSSQNATFAGDVTIKNSGGSNTFLKIEGAEGQDSELHMYGDDGDDNSDKWMIVAGADNIYFKSYTTGSWVAGVNIKSDGSIHDSKGNLRSIPLNSQTSNYTLVAADAGKMITTAGNSPTYTIPASVFSAGDAISIVNDSGSDVTLTQGSGLTLYNSADTTTGNRTVAARGMITIYFINAAGAYISGAGLS